MRVNRLEHVNIMTNDVAGTCSFYADLIGLDPRTPPGAENREHAAWIYDSSDTPIIHLVSTSLQDVMPMPGRAHPAETTGAIDHVALNCDGYDEMEARFKDRGVEYTTKEVPQVSLRQIFTLDPNGVLLEMNFYAD